MKASPLPLKRAGLIGLGLSLLLCLSSNFVRADAAMSVAAVTPAPAIFLPIVMKNSCAATLPPPGNWLAYVNYYRALACLPAVTENASYTDGALKHANYMVINDEVTHYESQLKPGWSSAGDLAGLNSNIMGSSSSSYADLAAIDLWMQGPFHAVGIIDPKLQQTGFGSARDSSGGIQMAAALDILQGRGSVPASVTFPVKWPSDGMTVNLLSYLGYEFPDPLTSCNNFSTPTGLPIILQLGTGGLTPNVTAYSFMQGSNTLLSCEFDETNYMNSTSPTDQQSGRDVLNARDAIVIIPRDPLSPGATYTVSITTNGQTYTWSFTVSRSATALETAPEAVIR